ncbi:MAG: Crp/Fnr family transcriptional regulator [Magnetospiraceae bacterium]
MTPFDSAAEPYRDTCVSCAVCPARRFSVCGGVAEGAEAQLENLKTPITVPAGTLLFSQGDPATHAFSLRGGMVILSLMTEDGRRQGVDILVDGGYIPAPISGTYGVTAHAAVDTALCRYEASALRALMAQSPEAQRKALDLAESALETARYLLLLVGRHTALEKTAAFLLLMHRRSIECNGVAGLVHLPKKREDIADFLGMTPETICRTLALLRRNGQIDMPSASSARILNLESLKSLAGDPNT